MTAQVRAGGVTFSVESAGSGPPLVFIHGWSMSGRFFRRQLAGLSGRFRVIVPDLRGHGASEKVLHGHTVPNYASDLHAILAKLAVRRPVLVGWSMGAMVGYEYLRAYGSGGVAGLVIVDQPPSDFAWEGYEFGVFTMAALRDMNERAAAIGPGRGREGVYPAHAAQAGRTDPGMDGRRDPSGPASHCQHYPARPDAARLPRLPPADRLARARAVRRGRQAH